VLKGLVAEVITSRQLDGGVRMVVKGPMLSAVAVKMGNNNNENYPKAEHIAFPPSYAQYEYFNVSIV
jgi:hypothetical protein